MGNGKGRRSCYGLKMYTYIVEAKILSIISEEKRNFYGKEFVEVKLIIELRGEQRQKTIIISPETWERQKERGFLWYL